MIYKCITLFNLLPTSQPHHWLIAADWLEENEKYIEANAFREGIQSLLNHSFGDREDNVSGWNFYFGNISLGGVSSLCGGTSSGWGGNGNDAGFRWGGGSNEICGGGGDWNLL